MAEPIAKRTATPTSISDTPETLIIKILSLLPTSDAVSFCCASPKFRHLHHSIPTLDFTFSKFPFQSTSPRFTREVFVDFVNQTLILRPRATPLRKFRLVFHYTRHRRHNPLLHSWLRYALSSNATEIELNLNLNLSVDLNDMYDLPHDDDDSDSDSDDNDDEDNRLKGETSAPCLFDFHFSDIRNSCVEKLTVCRCELTVSPLASGGFDCLRSLVLSDLRLTEEMLPALLCGCSNLESLSLVKIRGITNLKICSDKLKELDLNNFIPGDFRDSSLEIVAPSLRSVALVHVYLWTFRLDDSCGALDDARVSVHKLDRVWGDLVSSLTSAKRLRLGQNYWFEFWGIVSYQHLLFSNLEHLVLKTGYSEEEMLGLAVFLQHSPKLRTMVLDCDQTNVDGDKGLPEHFLTRPLLLNIPSLKKVEIINWMGENGVMDFIVLLKMQKVVLEKVVVVASKVGDRSLPPLVFDWTEVPPKVTDGN